MLLKKLFSYSILIAGSLSVIMGLAFAAMYVYGAIIARWGEADQSLLFWHLPILFIGIFSIAVGLVLSFWGINRLRSDNLPQNSPAEEAETT